MNIAGVLVEQRYPVTTLQNSRTLFLQELEGGRVLGMLCYMDRQAGGGGKYEQP